MARALSLLGVLAETADGNHHETLESVRYALKIGPGTDPIRPYWTLAVHWGIGSAERDVRDRCETRTIE